MIIYMAESIFEDKQRDILEKKWQTVKEHYEAAYKQCGFKFTTKPTSAVINDLYRKLKKLRDEEFAQRTLNSKQ